MLRVRRVAISLCVVCLTLAGCSRSNDPPAEDPLGAVIEASTGPAHTTGTVTAAGTVTADAQSDLEGGFAGRDVVSGRGWVTGVLQSAGGSVPLEIRWLDGRIFVRRTAPPGAVTGAAGQFVTAEPGLAEWGSVVATSLAARMVNVFIPAAMATELRSLGNAESRPGPQVDGEATTAYTGTRAAGVDFYWSDASTIELLVDGDQRIVRVSMRSGANGIAYDVDYDAGAVDVEKPPASDLAGPSTTVAALEPTGAFVPAGTGTDAGQQWTVQRAPGSRNTTCWKLDATPTLVLQGPTNGSDTRCVAPPDPNDDRAEQVQFVLTTDGAQANALVAVLPPPGATSAILGYAGGEKTTVPVGSSAPFVVVFPSDAPLVFVGFEGGGDAIDCGVGGVARVGDITDGSLTSRAFGVPWTCEPRD